MLRALLSLLLMTIATSSMAQRAVMEGVNASKYTVKIDTINARVLIGTTSYTGSGISNVGLFVASNVVVGNLSNKNACVLYSTGAVNCNNASFSGSIVSGSSITATSSVTASAFVGDGSHLSGINTSVFKSSYAYSFTQTGIPSSFSGVPISSVTLATTGSRPIRICFHASGADDSLNRQMCGVVLQNGSYIAPYASNHSMACDKRVTTATGAEQTIGLCLTLSASQAPAGGTNIWALYLKVDAGTVNSPGVVGDDPNMLGIEEL